MSLFVIEFTREEVRRVTIAAANQKEAMAIVEKEEFVLKQSELIDKVNICERFLDYDKYCDGVIEST
jgi:hypothetical protein